MYDAGGWWRITGIEPLSAKRTLRRSITHQGLWRPRYPPVRELENCISTPTPQTMHERLTVQSPFKGAYSPLP